MKCENASVMTNTGNWAPCPPPSGIGDFGSHKSAITVAGIVGYSASELRISVSNASANEPFGARRYCGGSVEVNADLTVFLAIPSLLEIS